MENRASAYAMQNGASVLSVVVGPGKLLFSISQKYDFKVGQLAFSGVPYPGITIFSNFRISVYTGIYKFISGFIIYSAPIWIALITNVIAIVFITVMFRNLETDGKPLEKEFDNRTIFQMFKNLQSIRRRRMKQACLTA